MAQISALRIEENDLANLDVFVRGGQHEIWRRMRAEEPIHWNPGNDRFIPFWSVTKYADLIAVSRDTTTYSSQQGISMAANPADPATLIGAGKMMIITDPPRHVRLRRLVNKGFTPRATALLEPSVREITTKIIDDVAPRGACDFVTDVAALLPLAVICSMMGIPQEDWPMMFELTNQGLGSEDPEYQTVPGSGPETAARSRREMFAYFAWQAEERRRERRDDLVSVLVGSDVDGESLSEEELLFFCQLLILAGNETTRNAISGGLLALFEHPEQRARLQHDPTLLPTAVEEILRWTSPVAHMMRYVTRDAVLGGQPLRAGERVLLWYPSANRDEEVFPNANTFDVGRTPNEHIAFGIGEHFCLGASFARLELRVMFETLLARLPDIALAGPVDRLRSGFIGGIKHMPVQFTPQPSGA
ncbi:MAG: cytochrome P450 [Thermomicrobiales bacterium]